MPNNEKQLAIIQDVILQSDPKHRYDLYVTDRRVAIVCLGKMSRETDSYRSLSAIPAAFGMPAPSEGSRPKSDLAEIEQEISRMSLDDLLRLSKKSCYYTLEEIEELRVVLGRRPAFRIISEDCASKFSPDPRQMMALLDLLTAFEPLRSKLAVAGKWDVLEKIFQAKLKK
jgi:hypothetical protein